MFSDISFKYKGEALAAEIILIFILAGLEAVRIFLGIYNMLFISFYTRYLKLMYHNIALILCCNVSGHNY